MNSVAQLWNGVLAPARATDWSQAGATIVNRSTICATPSLTSGSSNASANTSAINSAISSCSKSGNPPAQTDNVVQIPAGTWYVTGITIRTSNVTLRGAGPDQTSLIFTSYAGCNGSPTYSPICIYNGDPTYSGYTPNSATWTAASYAQGSASITLSNYSNLRVGNIVVLDQTNDCSSGCSGFPGDSGGMYICSDMTNCGWSGNSVDNGRSGRTQTETVVVTSCGTSTLGASCTSGNITFTPGLMAPNWSSSKSPGAWWGATYPVVGVGIEDLAIDATAVSTGSNGAIVAWVWGNGNWGKNVKTIGPTSGGQIGSHWLSYIAVHNTVRDSYMYGSNPTSGGYGVTWGYNSANNLSQNNICQHLASCMISQGGNGNVFGYNFAADNYYNNGAPNWQQQDADHHSVGDNFDLWEGQIGSGYAADGIHGGSEMLTVFRSRESGRDPSLSSGSPKTQSTTAANIYSLSRFENLVANVFGTLNYHTVYQTAATSASSNGSSTADTSIYVLGFSGARGGVNGSFGDDPKTVSSLMRWGNYDTVTGTNESSSNDTTGIRFVAAENASTAAVYPGLSSPSQTLPASFYLNSKPSWWAFPNGNANTPWPAIGPDVTGGNIANVGGHAYLTPAANCYLNVMGGLTDGTSGILTFNADNCYGSGSGGGTPPAPPSGLSAVVQ